MKVSLTFHVDDGKTLSNGELCYQEESQHKRLAYCSKLNWLLLQKGDVKAMESDRPSCQGRYHSNDPPYRAPFIDAMTLMPFRAFPPRYYIMYIENIQHIVGSGFTVHWLPRTIGS